jgi:hypothetical protein
MILNKEYSHDGKLTADKNNETELEAAKFRTNIMLNSISL